MIERRGFLYCLRSVNRSCIAAFRMRCFPWSAYAPPGRFELPTPALGERTSLQARSGESRNIRRFTWCYSRFRLVHVAPIKVPWGIPLSTVVNDARHPPPCVSVTSGPRGCSQSASPQGAHTFVWSAPIHDRAGDGLLPSTLPPGSTMRRRCGADRGCGTVQSSP